MKREREGGKRRVRETNSFQYHFRNSFTLFVDDLPATIDAWWLRRMFKEYGVIIDAFIPKKTRAKSNSKFGFVRFRYRNEANLAIEKMNGTRRHNAVLKVSMAHYGRERAECRSGDGCFKGIIQANGNEKGDCRMSYRQALTGVKMCSNIGDDPYHSQSEIEAIQSRVKALELEVERLQIALSCAMSDGKTKMASDSSFPDIERQQMEVNYGGERGGNTSIIIQGQQAAEAKGREGGITSSGGDVVSTVISKKSDVVSFSGDRRPARSGVGSGSGEDGKSCIINAVELRDVWDSKKQVLSSAVFESDEGFNGVSDEGFNGVSCDVGVILSVSSNLSHKCSTAASPLKVDRADFVGSISGDKRPAGNEIDSEEGSNELSETQESVEIEIASELSCARMETDMGEAAGSEHEAAVLTPKKLEEKESVESFSGDRWLAGSGIDSDTGVINVINAGGVWEAKFEDQ